MVWSSEAFQGWSLNPKRRSLAAVSSSCNFGETSSCHTAFMFLGEWHGHSGVTRHWPSYSYCYVTFLPPCHTLSYCTSGCKPSTNLRQLDPPHTAHLSQLSIWYAKILPRGSGVLPKGQHSWNISVTKEARMDLKVVLELSMECLFRGIFFCP